METSAFPGPGRSSSSTPRLGLPTPLLIAAAAQTIPTERSDPNSLFPPPIPQSTRADIMRWRGAELRSHTTGVDIEEKVGAAQVVGERIWFGKS